MSHVLVLPFVAPTPRHRLAAAMLVAIGVFCLFWFGAMPGAGELFPDGRDRYAHLVAFGGLAAVLWVVADARRAWLVVLTTALVGAADEISQAFHPGRTADLGDWACDLIAAVVAVVVLSLMQRSWHAARARRAARG